MGNKLFELIIYICLGIALVMLYFICLNVAEIGYGYTGYTGYKGGGRSHSVWYHRSYDARRSPSVRERSVGGNNFSGRGMSRGK